MRISSIEPNLLTNEIIQFCNNSKIFTPHFHIPLQSGSNKILKLMRRRYFTELYKERIEFIKSINPNTCIGVDVIVGFPGEEEEDFLKTYEFIKSLDISYLHVFTYSERPNTAALKIDKIIPKEERSNRSKMLHILSDKKKRSFYEGFMGETRPVLFESYKNEKLIGHSDNYIRVEASGPKEFINSIHRVNLIENQGSHVHGIIRD